MAEPGPQLIMQMTRRTQRGGAGGGRSKDDVALDLMKFIAVNSGFESRGSPRQGFPPKREPARRTNFAEDLLNLFDRCRKVVNKEV